MTRKRRTRQQALETKAQLAAIIKDIFDNNGQVVTHDALAAEHVARHKSTTASEDVHLYGGPAVVHLRNAEHYAIVPITSRFSDYTGDPDDAKEICDAVAGLGAGGARVGWYHPADRDDWLWVYYIGFLANAGMHAVFHAAKQTDSNPRLLSAKGRRMVAGRSIAGIPIPPGGTEVKILTSRAES